MFSKAQLNSLLSLYFAESFSFPSSIIEKISLSIVFSASTFSLVSYIAITTPTLPIFTSLLSHESSESVLILLFTTSSWLLSTTQSSIGFTYQYLFLCSKMQLEFLLISKLSKSPAGLYNREILCWRPDNPLGIHSLNLLQHSQSASHWPIRGKMCLA